MVYIGQDRAALVVTRPLLRELELELTAKLDHQHFSEHIILGGYADRNGMQGMYVVLCCPYYRL